MLNLETDLLFLGDNLPALAGITKCRAGDYGYENFNHDRMGEEFRASRILARGLCGTLDHAKIIPDNGDGLIFSNNCHGYCHADGLIEFNAGKKKESKVLFSITADSPTIVFCSQDQSLIGIVNSGRKGCQLKIAEKAVWLIKEKASLDPKDLFVGIFPGICERCYPVNNDIGGLFGEFYRNGKLNLSEIIFNQLRLAGIKLTKISLAPYCSYCTKENNADSFFSYRRNSTTQRNAVFIRRQA